ncbi:MAG TPA: protein kinase [Terriglobales bacterium]|nr:protein kinase [Terriglobales bacterium]
MSVAKIGRYEIVGELGKGAMGMVYKAMDPNIGRTVALKTMRVDIHADKHDEMLRRFHNEARAAGALNHPNIVTIYDAGEADGVFYIAMEIIEGRSLSTLLAERKSLSAQEVVEIGTQVCAGLQYAHLKKVIHRDIKPANIMLSAGGQVKITDFGIAKAGASLTHSGEVVGTPNYMSPEQVKGRALDGRSDLFSTGVVLYEMLTGERPFTGDSVTTIIYKIVHETPIPPRELDVTIHPGLSMIVTKCLAKDPEDRYQEAVDLSTALKSYKIVSVPEPRHVAPPRPITPPTVATTPVPVFGAHHLGNGQTGTAVQVSPDAPTSAIDIRGAQQHKPPAKRMWVVFGILSALLIVGASAIRSFRSTPPSAPSVQQSTPAPPSEVPAPPVPQIPAEKIRQAQELAADIQRQVEQQLSTSEKVQVSGIGDLRITSNPSGAHVSIDGVSQEWFVTPFNAPPMKAGTHTLTANAPGLPAQTRIVEVVPRKKTVVDFQLAGDNAIYNIASLPNGAEILIDGVATGSRTPAQMMIKPGQHRVTLRLEGFEPVDVVTSAAPGGEVNLSPQLRARNSVDISSGLQPDSPGLAALARLRGVPITGEIPPGHGMIQVRTRPRSATVTVDGTDLSSATPARLPLKPGRYNVLVKKTGFRPVSRIVEVEEGKVVELDEVLLRQR